jgi:hypothetical protein
MVNDCGNSSVVAGSTQLPLLPKFVLAKQSLAGILNPQEIGARTVSTIQSYMSLGAT